ncbi:MAG TPA: hypothetical protein VMX55_01440 [candidate division Zixibacteria bacterium]|nr:hypothetical protein [candidate division Zixibacteria bacterium]
MPLDKDTLDFLVNETIENTLEDTKMKLNELAMKYKLEINVRSPIIIEIKQVDKGKVIWQKE